MSGFASSSYILSATVAAVPSSATVVTLLAQNANAKMRMIYNDSSAILYIKYGSAASSSDHTVQLAAGGTHLVPIAPLYAGIITGLWASATGNARVTEG